MPILVRMRILFLQHTRAKNMILAFIESGRENGTSGYNIAKRVVERYIIKVSISMSPRIEKKANVRNRKKS